MLSLAQEYGIIQAAPHIKLRRENQRTAVWDAKSEEALLKAAPQPLKDAFLLCTIRGCVQMKLSVCGGMTFSGISL
jgi:hypothetical protein